MSDDDGIFDQSDDDLSQLEDDITENTEVSLQGSELPDTLYRLKADPYNETYYASFDIPLETGANVIAATRYGKDICKVLGLVKAPKTIRMGDLIKIERAASPEDMQNRRQLNEKEKNAFDVCLEKIREHRLPMKLVFAHYLFDEAKVLFFFTAEARVDFRNLVKDLVSIFKMRIELRQIGIRDEARVMGGCGVCGRLLCCHGVTDKLIPVSIKMAKDQNLSLNSLKISGPCGRLLCCLAYEFNFYKDARKTMPQEGTRIAYDGTVFRVTELNIPAGRIKLAGDDGRYLDAAASRFVQQEGRWKITEEAV